MTDLFSSWDVGEGYGILIQSFKCESDVTKGELVVADTHTAGEYVSVSTAGAAAVDVIGVALASGAAGEYIPVMLIGIVKVTNSTNAIAAGEKVIAAANGKIDVYPATPSAGDEEKIVGRALQDFADGDTGLILVGSI